MGPELTIGDGLLPAVAMLDDGAYAVAQLHPAEDGSASVFVRTFGPGIDVRWPGDVAGPAADVEGFTAGGPAIAATADGGFAVAWTGPRSDGVPGVFLRRFDAGGRPVVDAERVSGDERLPAHQPALAAAPDGRLAVSWTVENPRPDVPVEGFDFSNLFARLFAADGTPAGAPFQVNSRNPEEQGASRLAFTADGTLVAVWQSWQEEHFYDVLRRRFGAGGVPLEDDQQVNQDAILWDFQPAVTPLAGGGHLVAWVRGEAGSGPGTLRVRVFAADGAPLGDERVIGGGEGTQVNSPAVAALPGGGAGVLWLEGCGLEICPPVFQNQSLLFRVVDAGGEPVAGPAQVAATAVAAPGSATLAAAADGAAVVAWSAVTASGDDLVLVRRLAAPCREDAAALCLLGDRFQVTVDWRGPAGGTGAGIGVERGDAWGTFWFFRPGNPEIAVKVLDGGPVNGHFWVFRASLSNVAYTLTVLDTGSGRRLVLDNPAGTFASSGDTTTLPADTPAGAGTGSALASAAPPRLLAFPRRPAAPLTPAIPCTPSPTVACFEDGLFAVSVEWEDFFGNRGLAEHGALTEDSVYFWFFRAGNPEVFFKLLDGGPVNGHYWIFWGGLSNVAYRITVFETQHGGKLVYENPRGHFGSRGDTAAFGR